MLFGVQSTRFARRKADLAYAEEFYAMPKEEATPEEPVGPNHNYPLEQAPGLEEKPGNEERKWKRMASGAGIFTVARLLRKGSMNLPEKAVGRSSEGQLGLKR